MSASFSVSPQILKKSFCLCLQALLQMVQSRDGSIRSVMEKGDTLLASVHYPSVRDKMHRLQRDYTALCKAAMVRTASALVMFTINCTVVQEHGSWWSWFISLTCFCSAWFWCGLQRPGSRGKPGKAGEGTGGLPQRAPGSGALAAADVQQDGDSRSKREQQLGGSDSTAGQAQGDK